MPARSMSQPELLDLSCKPQQFVVALFDRGGRFEV
jgi:hypothetical protein